jgi:hypothetical protein
MWPTIHPVARFTRRLTLMGLAAGAAALVSLVAWTSLLRVMWDPVHGFPDFVPRPQGFHLRGIWTTSFLLRDHTLGATIAGVLAAAAIALAVLIWRRRRWAMLATSLGSLATIAVPWLGRAYVVHLETLASGRHWAARSRYVAAATDLAIGATLFLVLLAVVAAIGFATERQRARAAAPGASAAGAPDAGVAA